MFTVLGSSGFIGRHLVDYLKDTLSAQCYTPGRNDTAVLKKDLGHVIYCVGLTADFRELPFATVRAHVCYLLDFLERARFSSFLYISSTRLYKGSDVGIETSAFNVSPADPDDLYNISKLMGESVCLSSKRENVRVVRLSNVFGKDYSSLNFLDTIIRDAVERKKIILRTSLSSQKDFVGLSDVLEVLPKIAVGGKDNIYNVASGENTSNEVLTTAIARLVGCEIQVENNAPEASFPAISVKRIANEFNYSPLMLLDVIDGIVADYIIERSANDKN